MLRFLGIAVLLMVMSCAVHDDGKGNGPGETTGESLEEQRQSAIDGFDHNSCTAKGGEMRLEGILGMPRCTISFDDAGERCQGSGDCKGRCLASGGTDFSAAPGEAFGACAANDSPFGCYSELEDGTPLPAICVD